MCLHTSLQLAQNCYWSVSLKSQQTTLLQFITGRFRGWERIILIQPDLFTQICFVMSADVTLYTVFTQHKAKKEVNEFTRE